MSPLVRVRVGLFQIFRSQKEIPFFRAGNEHRLGPGEGDDLGVGGPVGRPDEDLVSGAKEGEAGVEKGVLGPVAHHDPVPVHLFPELGLEIPGDGLSQVGRSPERECSGSFPPGFP